VNESAMNAKELVMEYFETCDRKDFKSARNYVSDNVSYMSPIGSFDRAVLQIFWTRGPTKNGYQEGIRRWQ
jgi:ketosteroid isomerase-like protein